MVMTLTVVSIMIMTVLVMMTVTVMAKVMVIDNYDNDVRSADSDVADGYDDVDDCDDNRDHGDADGTDAADAADHTDGGYRNDYDDTGGGSDGLAMMVDLMPCAGCRGLHVFDGLHSLQFQLPS